MTRWTVAALAGAAGVAAVATATSAQQPGAPPGAAARAVAVCDSATIALTLGGQAAGRELFESRCLADGTVTARGRSELRFTGATADFTTTIELDRALAARRVTVSGTSNGQPVDDTLLFRDTSATLTHNGASREIPTARGASYLGNNLFYNLPLIVARYDAARGGLQQFPIFPNVTMSIQRLGRDSVRASDDSVARPTAFDRYDLHVGLQTLWFWTDSRGRMALLVAPQAQLVAARADYLKFAEPLVEVALTAARRAQTAQLDYSAPAGAAFTAEEVKIDRGTFTLAGTLLLPKGKPGPFPAVVTITGSGQQTRDEALPGIPGLERYGLFRQIGETLAASGIAVLRVDDRGVGQSTGMNTLDSATTFSFADDVRAELAFLRARRDIDPARLALIGHSEGGIIAPLVAVSDPRLKAIVLLAGTGKAGEKVLVDQAEDAIARSPELTDAQKAQARTQQREAFRKLRAGEPVEGIPNPAWWRAMIDYAPDTTIRRVRQPILILQGGNDRQVTAEQAQILADAAKAGGNRDVTMRLFPTLNHLFLVSTTGAVAEYGSLPSSRIGDDVLGTLRDWLVARLGVR